MTPTDPGAESDCVKVSIWSPATPERAFAGWTEPDQLRHWFGPEGYHAEIIDLDLRLGGKWRFRMVAHSGHASHHSGRYVEITPPHRLVFTWTSEEDTELTGGRDTLVTVSFDAEKDGVRITVLHEQLPGKEAVSALSYGWRGGLVRLLALHEGKGRLA